MSTTQLSAPPWISAGRLGHAHPVTGTGPAPWTCAAARSLLNRLTAVVLLLLAAPLMLLIACLVRLTSPGPVIYRQRRVGVDRRRRGAPEPYDMRVIDYGGRIFTMYKFRTMQHATSTAQVWATHDDPRITRLGRILRRTRLDELPQLWNVLRGDMSLIGPRPEQPDIFLQLRGLIDGYEQRQRVLPGITGWAQVNQAYDASVDDVRNKLRLDLEFAERASPSLDVRIMLRTVPVMVKRVGAR
ncbi:MAG TPA: sugar transferase [Longimicrobiales bacterium]|nr:sugar transferase [Longimicrobiales bacterium]